MRLYLFATASIIAFACGPGTIPLADTYCQSGPKYGTQCTSLTDVRASKGQRPPLPGEPNIASSPPSPWSSKSKPPTGQPSQPSQPAGLVRAQAPIEGDPDGGTN